ncbi:hypothetical protein VTJ49DRAFT_6695 [Mycothermus thermophilus]|uniref:Translation initiation factor eIF2B subunit delta n=1 Tax=Humicola insolens TaxID=85995 RepID=A0ABR3VJP8_HUMIN
MRSSQCLCNSATALRRVFINNAAATWDTSGQLQRLLLPAISNSKPLQHSSSSPPHRPFTTHLVTQFRGRSPGPPAGLLKPAAPGPLRDYDIPFPWVQLRNENGTLSPPQEKSAILKKLNPVRQSLVLLAFPRTDESSKGPEYPICRIVDRQEELAKAKEKLAQEKAKKGPKVVEKELEINWAIAPHDLRTRMNQLAKFLAKGYKVKVTMSHPKRKDKKRASLVEAKQVLKTVEETISEVSGAEEEKAREGDVGTTLVLHLHNPKPEKAAELEHENNRKCAGAGDPWSGLEKTHIAGRGVHFTAEAPAPTNATSAPANTEKLTPAQLKAKAKAEKAARRAQVKEARAAAAAAAPAPQEKGAAVDGKGGKPKGKQDGQQLGVPRASVSGRRPSMHRVLEKEKEQEAHKDVHPAVLAVGQMMATYVLNDSIARLKAMLLAFKKVIESYETPKGSSLSRHFVPHVLNPQIEYLTECRPMCFAMGNAIRLLKGKINKFDIDTPEDEAKEALLEWVDFVINERITLAEYAIALNAAESINEGDTILTYGRHRLVEKALLKAKELGKFFDVIVIDDHFERDGQNLATTLCQAGIHVLYSPNLGGLRPKVAAASNVFLGGEGIFANGSMNARSGTADVAMAAANAGVKVMVLCESINFDRDRVSVDSMTYNEVDPERNTPDFFRVLYDNTHDKYISGVMTEFESGGGSSPAQAILALLRKQEDPLIA